MTLAACWPLLLPPGVCVCAAGEDLAALLHSANDTDSEPAHPDRHHDHAPGCPAHGAERAVTPEVADHAGHLVPLCVFVGAPDTATPAGPPGDPETARRTFAPKLSDPPRFVKHCALLF